MYLNRRQSKQHHSIDDFRKCKTKQTNTRRKLTKNKTEQKQTNKQTQQQEQNKTKQEK